MKEKDDAQQFIPFAEWVRQTQTWLEARMPRAQAHDEAAWLRFRMALLGDN